jgi:hypothetical protein
MEFLTPGAHTCFGAYSIITIIIIIIIIADMSATNFHPLKLRHIVAHFTTA